MSRQNIETMITEIVEPITSELNLELVDVEFVQEGKNSYLRVFIDNPGGIGVEDCQAVSQKLSSLLDEQDPIKQSYLLEVSSPGLDRPLKKEEDFVKYKGELIKVTTYAAFDGKKTFIGTLGGLENDQVTITNDEGEYVIPRAKISSVKLEVKI